MSPAQLAGMTGCCAQNAWRVMMWRLRCYVTAAARAR
jgi:hypothetical protein